MKKIKVYLKRHDLPPQEMIISSAYGNIQNIIGKMATVSVVGDDMEIIYDPEGYYRKNKNCVIDDEEYFGNIIFCGSSGNGVDHVPMKWDEFKKKFRNLFNPETEFGKEEMPE